MRNSVYNLDNLVGAKILDVDDSGYDLLKIVTDKGTMRFVHYQNCCEDVSLFDGFDDLKAMIGEEIKFAEETNNGKTDDYEPHDSYTWTFYKISTMWKDVTLRFIGESNGYYSEEVDLLWDAL
ncbi:MAG: DUF7448 domain-containing protein [Cetobacterium sp.]|uniref:DUF7448 domain-containing protein n=1 Tax=Cetobacterium sp. TaxID=2071632 RepID=UPI003F3EE105